MQQHMTSKSGPPAEPQAVLNKRSDRSIESRIAELRHRLLEIADLDAGASILGWDQATYMPAAGAEARGRQGALLRRLAHERSTDPALGRLIDALAPWA